MHTQEVGKFGENLACKYLRKKGYSIVETNYRTKIGEIDIVAIKNRKYIFVEVKTKTSDLKGKPYEHVNSSKVSKFKRIVNMYLLDRKLNAPFQLDVISIELGFDNNIERLQHFENITF